MTTRPATFGALSKDEKQKLLEELNEEDRQHRQRMIDFAKRQKPPLTPEQLAEAIKDFKNKHPEDFPE